MRTSLSHKVQRPFLTLFWVPTGWTMAISRTFTYQGGRLTMVKTYLGNTTHKVTAVHLVTWNDSAALSLRGGIATYISLVKMRSSKQAIVVE